MTNIHYSSNVTIHLARTRIFLVKVIKKGWKFPSITIKQILQKKSLHHLIEAWYKKNNHITNFKRDNFHPKVNKFKKHNLETFSFLQQCNEDLVNTEAALTPDPLLQGAFACEISGNHESYRIFSSHIRYFPKQNYINHINIKTENKYF